MGQIMGFTAPDEGRKPRQILRPATPRDLVLRQQWEEKQDEALETCREAAANLRRMSEVKFVAAQYNYDGSVRYLPVQRRAEDRYLRASEALAAQIRGAHRNAPDRSPRCGEAAGRLRRLWHHALLQHLPH